MRKLFIPVLLALVTPMVVVTSAAAASVPASSQVTDEKHEYCASIVSKERDERGLSKVVGTGCSTVSPEEAHREAKKAVPSDRVEATAVDTLLVNQYKHNNYDTLLYSFWGTAGPCDSEGYTLTNFATVANNVSSIKGYNSCDRATLTDANPAWTETKILDSHYIGDRLNDDVDYVHTYRSW